MKIRMNISSALQNSDLCSFRYNNTDEALMTFCIESFARGAEEIN